MDHKSRSLLWVTFLFLDSDLHKTSRVEILRHLMKQGYDVTLLAAYSHTKPLSDKIGIRIIPIPVKRVPLFSVLILSALLVFLLPFLVLRLRPDFVIVEPYDGTFLGLISTRVIPSQIRPKMIVDVRSPPVEISGFNGWLHTFCFDAAILIAKHLLDGLTIITSMMRREICSGFHIDPRTVGVWTSGVSTDFFYPAPLDSARAKTLREEMGLTGKFVILYHGVLTSKRGVFEAAASLKLLDARYRQIVLLILGKGPAHTAIVEASRKEIEEGRIIFHDPVDYEQIPHYISMCDIGIVPLPDIPEWRCQCPLNLLECLSMGKVVVATNIPANREVAGESKCVIYAANAEPREFAKAIAYAFDNRNMLHTWGAYCRTIVEKRYAWTQVARNLDRYLSTLGQSHVPKITLA